MAKDVNTKAADFKRLAEARGNKCLNDIRLLGNLASGNYESTPEQRAILFGTLQAELDRVAGLFSGIKENGPRITL